MIKTPAFVSHTVRRAAARFAPAAAAALLALSGMATLLAARPARAQNDALTYSSNRRAFNAGVLLLQSTIDDTNTATLARGPENPDPYVFFMADARSDVKPLDWEFVNPLAPKTVTAAEYGRWLARDPGNPYQMGQQVTKNMACYWEVSLQKTSIEDLLQYDLLFITHHRDTKFTPDEREKLRKLVDAGGVVWIEDCGNMRIRPSGPFFLDDLQFRNDGSRANAGPIINAAAHPILNNPYRLSFQEIANLGDKNYGNFYMSRMIPADDTPTGIPVPRNNSGRSAGPPNPNVLINIVGNRATATGPDDPGLPYIAAGNYGSGAVIATSSDSGCDINDYAGGANVGSGGNSGAYCGPNIQTAHPEDLKFVYNLAAWGSATNTERRNPRRTASSFDSLGAPLLGKFDFSTPGTPANSIVRSTSAPVVVQGVLLVTGLVNNVPTLRAYDTQPYRDLDGDGNGDDGLPDLNLGAPYDEIWRAPLGNGTGGAGQALLPSAPTSATLPDGTDAVFVTLPNGDMHGYRVFPRDSGRLTFQPQPVFAPNANEGAGTYPAGTATQPAVAPSPVYFEGRIHVVQPDARIRCVSAYAEGGVAAGTRLWLSADVVPAFALTPLGSPTVGFTRLTSTPRAANSNNSTLDLMLYEPASQAGGAGLPPVGRVLPYFLGARNEVLTVSSGQAQSGTVSGVAYDTRAFEGGSDRYFVADPSRGDGPFTTPRVRVFSRTEVGGNAISGRENYQIGNPSPFFAGQFIPSPNGGALSGRVVVSNRTPGGALPTAADEIIVAVDYDVLYVTTKYPKPVGLSQDGTRTSPGGGGAITTAGALVQGTVGANLSTLALSPNDTLVFSATEQDPSSATGAIGGGGSVSSVYGVNEQPASGASRARWRYSLFSPTTPSAQQATDPGLPLRNGADVDPYPIQNSLKFNANWPDVDEARPLAQPEALANVQALFAPVVTNTGITYVIARAESAANGSVTVLMAFDNDREFVLRLGGPLAPGSNVSLEQTSALTGQPFTVSAGQAGTANNAQFTVDASRGTITINNFVSPLGAGGPGGNALSASQSFVVRATPLGATAEVTTTVRPQPSSAPPPGFPPSVADVTSAARTIRGDYSPLLWYYVLPGTPLSSPTLSGSHLYYSANVGGTAAVIAVDSDPQGNDPTVRQGQQVFFVADTMGTAKPTINHARWKQALRGLPGAGGQTVAVTSVSAPVGGQDILAVNSDQGTFTFENVITLIGDGKRLIEVRPDGAAVWTLDATVRVTTAGGEAPRFGLNGTLENPDTATGRQTEERTPISRPSVVRRLGASDLLIADTGNNRAVRVERSGRELWALQKINDPYGIAAQGDSLTLNGPTDIQYWPVTQFGANGRPIGFEAHYLIADANNNRIIEVVDFYDRNGRLVGSNDSDPDHRLPNLPAGTSGEHVLVWTTRTTSRENRALRYQSASRFFGSRNVDGQLVSGVPTLVAVVGNLRASGGGASAGSDFTGGALVSVRYNPYNPFNVAYPLRDEAGNTVGNFNPWPVNADPATTEPTGNGLIDESVDDLVIPSGLIPGVTQNTIRRISRPLYFQQITLPEVQGAPKLPGDSPVPGRRQLFLLCDAGGVYEVEPRIVDGRSVRFVNWMFRQEDYDRMNRARFNVPGGIADTELPRLVAASVSRLPNGGYLITNSFSGPNRLFSNRQFNGEVFEVRPTAPNLRETLGFGRFGDFSAPRIVREQNGLRQQMGTDQGGNTQLLEQPLFASRLF